MGQTDLKAQEALMATKNNLNAKSEHFAQMVKSHGVEFFITFTDKIIFQDTPQTRRLIRDAGLKPVSPFPAEFYSESGLKMLSVEGVYPVEMTNDAEIKLTRGIPGDPTYVQFYKSASEGARRSEGFKITEAQDSVSHIIFRAKSAPEGMFNGLQINEFSICRKYSMPIEVGGKRDPYWDVVISHSSGDSARVRITDPAHLFEYDGSLSNVSLQPLAQKLAPKRMAKIKNDAHWMLNHKIKGVPSHFDLSSLQAASGALLLELVERSKHDNNAMVVIGSELSDAVDNVIRDFRIVGGSKLHQEITALDPKDQVAFLVGAYSMRGMNVAELTDDIEHATKFFDASPNAYEHETPSP